MRTSVDFELEDGLFGPRLVLTGPWHARIADAMRQDGIRELYLNEARGWSGRSLEFLEDIPDLVAFGILDFRIHDISPIHRLTSLRGLEVSTYCRTPVEFSSFPALEHCTFYWRPGSESLFDRTAVTHLFVHRYDGALSEPFARLRALQSLSIANSSLAEIRYLGDLAQLTFLGLYNVRQLRSLSGLERLQQLEILELNGCKSLGAVEELASLTHLRKLQLNDSGRITSIRPIRFAVDLEEVLFYESTNIVDGDLTPLTALPRLRKVSFQNRAHYSHKRENFGLAS
jgi:Leucine-rich repeat (LRR) protein